MINKEDFMELDELTQGMDIQWVSHTSHARSDLAERMVFGRGLVTRLK